MKYKDLLKIISMAIVLLTTMNAQASIMNDQRPRLYNPDLVKTKYSNNNSDQIINISIKKKYPNTLNKKKSFNSNLLAAKKLLETGKNNQGKYFLNLAGDGIDIRSLEGCMMYNQILHIALQYDLVSFLQKRIYDLMNLYTAYGSDKTNFRVLLPPIEKFILKSGQTKNNDFLNFIENIIFNFPNQYRISSEPSPKKEKKLYLGVVRSYPPDNPVRIKGIELIRLSKIYTKFKLKNKLKETFKKIATLWKLSLANPSNGKSFEIYLPRFIKYLCKFKLYQEAVFLAKQIPYEYPFIISSMSIREIEKRRKQVLLTKYNKTAKKNRLKSFSIIIESLIKQKRIKYAKAIIKKVVPSNNDKLQLFTLLYKPMNNISGEIIEELLNNLTIQEIIIYSEFDQNSLIAITQFYISKNKNKGLKIVSLLLNSIKKNITVERLTMLSHLSDSLSKYNPDLHGKLNKFIKDNLRFTIDNHQIKTIELAGLLLEQPHPAININFYIKTIKAIINSVSRSKNPDRYNSRIADIHIQSARILRRVGYINKALNCLKKAELNISSINNLRLKLSYITYVKKEYKKTYTKNILTESSDLR